MKKLSLLLCLCVLVSCAPRRGASSSPGIPDRPDKLGMGDVKFRLPQTDRWVLSNGLVVFYRYDDELPRINGSLYFPGGGLYEPEELAGISNAVGAQLRDGSIKGVSPAEFDRKLDNLAVSIETSYGAENGGLSFGCLSEDFETVLEISSKILREPAFDSQRFELWRKLSIDGIQRRRDDPQLMAFMMFAKALFGDGSPFARFPTEAGINRLKRADLIQYAERFIRPNGAILAASGSVPKERFAKLVEKYFGDWKPRTDPLPALPAVDHKPEPAVYVLEREFVQSSVIIGHLGPPRFTPDVYEMNIYNRVLGAMGFGSRLFDQIRTQLGLAYDVSGGIYPGVVAGSFQISLASRNEAALEAVRQSLSITRETLDQPPQQIEFEESKSAVEQSFAFRFDSEAEIVQRAATQELLHFPEDYDRTYLERIARVTPDMVREVGRKWVHPKDAVVVIVGGIPATRVAQGLGGDRPVYRISFDTEPRVLERVN